MNRSESKFANTAAKMNSALVELLDQKDFIDVSIMDICNKAGVNRSTFYAHYDNTRDLLEETRVALINKFFAELSIDSPPDLNNIDSIDRSELNFVSPKYLVPYLEFIRKNKRLFKIFNENAHVFNITDMDNMLVERLAVPVLAKFGMTDKKFIYYMQRFFSKESARS